MNRITRKILLLTIVPMVLFFGSPIDLFGQIEEPEVRVESTVGTKLTDEYRAGLGFEFLLNNFGFAIGGEYRRVVAPQTEAMINLRITGLRDASEQTFTDIFFGQQVVPNKFKRAFAFPLMLGLRQRLFANFIQDQYRFFVSASGGPAAVFAYPYFNDTNDNGFRENFRGFSEPVNDIFSGFGDGDWHLGGAGELKLAVDFGRNFSGVTSVEFGYFFYVIPDGIQMMQPSQPIVREGRIGPDEFPFELNEDGSLALQPFFEKQTFFGSPQITFVFGKLW